MAFHEGFILKPMDILYSPNWFAKRAEVYKEVSAWINKPFDEVFKKPTREQIIDLMNGKSPEEVFGNKSTSDEDEKVEV